jgi:hypothetical protein
MLQTWRRLTKLVSAQRETWFTARAVRLLGNLVLAWLRAWFTAHTAVIALYTWWCVGELVPFVGYFTDTATSFSAQRQMVGHLMYEELEKIWKEMVVV